MISIVIPAFNEAKTIGRTLDSLAKQTIQEPFEVIVVDNNSTDGTAQAALRSAGKVQVHVIHELKSGRGAARAAGFQTAVGDIICSTDADTLLPENWLVSLTAPLKDGTYVATASSAQIKDCSSFTNWFFNWFQPTLMRVYQLIFGHVFLSGFSFAIKKEVYVASGGFDTHLNALEDNDLGFKVHRIGKIKFVSNCPVTTSGRRFQKSLFGGLASYIKPFVDYFILHKKQAYLRDVRDE